MLVRYSAGLGLADPWVQEMRHGWGDLYSHFSLLSAVVPDPESLKLVFSLLRDNYQIFSPVLLVEQMNEACREAGLHCAAGHPGLLWSAMHRDGSEDVANGVGGEWCKLGMPCGVVMGKCGKGWLWQTALQGPGASLWAEIGHSCPRRWVKVTVLTSRVLSMLLEKHTDQNNSAVIQC